MKRTNIHIFDRIDSLLFVMPAFALFILLLS